MIDLTPFQRDALSVIAGLDDPHGLAINEELEEYYGREINHGQLYQNLNALVEKGLVTKSKRDDRSNEYSLSGRGLREIEHRREWENSYIGELLES